MYFVVEGEVRATSYSLEGKEVIFRDIVAGEMFGEYAAIDGRPRAADVVALDKVICCYDEFEQLVPKLKKIKHVMDEIQP